MRALAIALPIAGIILMIIGIWRTWHDWGRPGGMWGPPLAAIRRAWQDLVSVAHDLWRRILRRPPSRVVRAGTADGVHVGSFDARGRSTYPPVDPSDLVAATVELDRRIRLLVDRLADVQEHGQDEAKAWRAASADLSARLDREVASLRDRDQRVALDGLYWQTAGIVLTAVGLGLQALLGP